MSYTPKRAASSSEEKKTVSAAKAKQNMSAADEKKKKALTIAIVVVLCIVIAISLLFIFSPSDGSFLGIRGAGVISGSGNGNVAQTQDGTTNITPYYKNGVLPTAADRHDITLVPNGGANASELFGKWKLDQGTTYMFDGRGRGILLTGVDNYTFVYSAENGKLGIDMDTSAGNDFEYDYSVSGDSLTMIRDGKTFKLTKVEE
ncbi:DUF5640 domain-containing protein [Ruminococcus sp.]|uniref:DUF5640 domain-containing protein n=1 Tax=Ruminococcus sp. TaxID=41978 RepID=UPI0038693F72